ncbi:IucA/IucC family protein [Brevibacillus sp. GCM10020057]|uniref:IucA/IucC family protein n=1 Tax=Brevibacillus sp. GCM10020057 TaxID=3317327 RepID=UPI003640A336
METDLKEREASLQHQAEQLVFCDLINALLQENLAGMVDRAKTGVEWFGPSEHECCKLNGEELYFYLPIDTHRCIVFRVKAQPFIQPYKISRLPVVVLDERNEEVRQLDPFTFMQTFAEALPASERTSSMPNLAGFLDELRDSIQHTALSLQSMTAPVKRVRSEETSLVHMERLSALRDRPFHPTSRAKRGWSSDDYKRYSPEYGQSFGLDWIGVRRDHIRASTDKEIAPFILADHELETLRRAASRAGIDERDYLLLPVHPWQMEHVLPTHYRAEWEQRICVPVIRGLGDFRPTSSVRAVVPVHGGTYHLKVPIGITSLGALRILPPRYLHNGAKGQALLQQVIERDKWLRERLRLCDESNWWGFHNPAADPFADKPGHLACLIRAYPADLLENHEEVALIPMSALAAIDGNRQIPVFEKWLAQRSGQGSQQGEARILALLREICQMLIGTSLRLFRYGMMPEIHGQNVLLIVRNHRVDGILLRDHDTIRLHPAWLKQAGLVPPPYIVKPGTPNSLIHDTPEKLLAYFQTLGVQVNLYAIADALNKVYGIEEAVFWRVIESVVRESANEHDLPAEVRDVLERQLLAAETWPIRLLLTPLLKRVGTGGGSMPAAEGNTSNPLRLIREEDDK